MSTMDHLIMFWSLFFSQYCLRFYLLFWLPLNSNLAGTRNHLQLPQIWNPDEGTQLILYSDHFPLYYLYSAWSVRVWVLWQILNPFVLYIFKGIVSFLESLDDLCIGPSIFEHMLKCISCIKHICGSGFIIPFFL